MIKINIPASEAINIENLVLDYNGTIACDGEVIPGVMAMLERLRSKVKIYVLTADTYGTVRKAFEGTGIDVHILEKDNGTLEKYDFVRGIGLEKTLSIGNGNNDVSMLKESLLSIGVIGREGCTPQVIMNADIIVTDILAALEMLEDPIKIKATLRR